MRRVTSPLSFIILAALTWGINALAPCTALAKDRFYIETGAGISFMMGASGLFERPTQSLSDYGLGVMAGLAFVLQPQESWFALHIGAEYRYATSWDNGNQLSIQAPYPFLRLEASKKFFITLGVAPFLLLRDQPGYGFDALTIPAGAVGFLVDMGYNFRITPAVGIVFRAGVHTAFFGGVFSPLPGIDGSGMLRFYFDGGDSFTSPEEDKKKANRKYEGYRYPYGREKN